MQSSDDAKNQAMFKAMTGVTRKSYPQQTKQGQELGQEVSTYSNARSTGKTEYTTEDKDNVYRLFFAFMDLFGGAWKHTHGDEPSDGFFEFALTSNGDELARVRAHCQEMAATHGFKGFPPSLIEMQEMRGKLLELESYDVLRRVMAKQPANDVEKWMVVKKRYNLRMARSGTEIDLVRSFYRHGAQLLKMGVLWETENEILALPQVSTVNLNDKVRESFEPNRINKTKIQQRIERMKRAQAKQEPASDV